MGADPAIPHGKPEGGGPRGWVVLGDSDRSKLVGEGLDRSVAVVEEDLDAGTFGDHGGKARFEGIPPTEHDPFRPRASEGDGAVTKAETDFGGKLVYQRFRGVIRPGLHRPVDVPAFPGRMTSITPERRCRTDVDTESGAHRLLDGLTPHRNRLAEPDSIPTEVHQGRSRGTHIDDDMDPITILFPSVPSTVCPGDPAEARLERQWRKPDVEDHLQPRFRKTFVHREENDLRTVTVVARVPGTGPDAIDLERLMGNGESVGCLPGEGITKFLRGHLRHAERMNVDDRTWCTDHAGRAPEAGSTKEPPQAHPELMSVSFEVPAPMKNRRGPDLLAP